MTDAILYGLLEDVYAAFGKSAPAMSTRWYSSIQRRTTTIPDEAADDLREELEGCASLPQNIGLALTLAYARWLQTHPNYLEKSRSNCGRCHGGWLIFMDQAQPLGRYVRCPCCGGSVDAAEYARQRYQELRPGHIAPVVAFSLGWIKDHSEPIGDLRNIDPENVLGINAFGARK